MRNHERHGDEASGPRTSGLNAQMTRDEKTEKQEEIVSDTSTVIAVYNSHSAADNAVKELQRSGFDMKKLSVVGKDYQTDEQVVGFYNAGDRMKYWGKLGAFWGGLFGLLFGAAFFWVPGIGPMVVAGPLTAWIVAALEGAVAVGGLNAIGAGLYSIGIPKNSVLKYETAIKADKFLLVAHGDVTLVFSARDALHNQAVALRAFLGKHYQYETVM